MWHFFGKIKQEIVALIILIPLVVVLGLVLRSWPANKADEPVSAKSPVPYHSPLSTVQPTEQPTNQISFVTLTIVNQEQKQTYQVNAPGTLTVKTLLQQAEAQNLLTVEIQDYGQPLGVLITAINQVANDSQANKYWYLYINGELSSVGASNVKVSAGDVVEWRYESMHN